MTDSREAARGARDISVCTERLVVARSALREAAGDLRRRAALEVTDTERARFRAEADQADRLIFGVQMVLLRLMEADDASGAAEPSVEVPRPSMAGRRRSRRLVSEPTH
jgi:hypothetical protein